MSGELRGRTDERRAGDGDGANPVLELAGVSKAFGHERVIEDLDLQVRDGEILTLLGPSGCGKTTTLRLVSGLERPDEGVIRLRGDSVAGEGSFVAPEDRGVGVVFQEYALFPHLTARENVAFGIDDWGDEERERRVDELLELVDLDAQGDSYPGELSGGQQQRVALARSLAPQPEMLLLDEPFSNLDVDLRVQMREEVRAILKEAGVTAVSVTHDQEEAMSISDRVAVMNDGRIEQVGPPEAVFQHPESRFVAGFLGHASFLTGYVHGEEVRTGVGPIPLGQIHGLTPEYDMTRIDVLVRPDDLQATPVDAGWEDSGGGEANDAGGDAGEDVREDAADGTRGVAADGEGGDVDDDRHLGDNDSDGGAVTDGADGEGGDVDDDRHVGDKDSDGGAVTDGADGEVVGRRYLGPTVLYEVELAEGDRVECRHNHDERVPLETPVRVDLDADHELSWFPVAHAEGEDRAD